MSYCSLKNWDQGLSVSSSALKVITEEKEYNWPVKTSPPGLTLVSLRPGEGAVGFSHGNTTQPSIFCVVCDPVA